MSVQIETPYLLFLGDSTDPVDAKTARGIHAWRPEQCVAEIIISGAVLRYSINAERFNFMSLGGRRTGDVTQDFALLIQDLARFATNAVLNRGAEAIRRNQPFAYPTRNAFQEEIVWTLWQMKKRA